MDSFTEITAAQAWELIQSKKAVLVDIRDIQRFNYSHPKGAFHLTNQSYIEFEQKYDYEHPIIVMCYHGISSRNVAMFLIEQGYEHVYSLSGGFSAWVNAELPIEQ